MRGAGRALSLGATTVVLMLVALAASSSQPADKVEKTFLRFRSPGILSKTTRTRACHFLRRRKGSCRYRRCAGSWTPRIPGV